MKNPLIVSCLIWILLLCAKCKSETDTVTITKTEYNQLKGVPQPPKPEYPKKISVFDNWNNPETTILLVDSCEYFAYGLETQYGFMCHKGNCKFCQQRLEQTIRRIVQEEFQKK